jgi:hypothetical protein
MDLDESEENNELSDEEKKILLKLNNNYQFKNFDLVTKKKIILNIFNPYVKIILFKRKSNFNLYSSNNVMNTLSSNFKLVELPEFLFFLSEDVKYSIINILDQKILNLKFNTTKNFFLENLKIQNLVNENINLKNEKIIEDLIKLFQPVF